MIPYYERAGVTIYCGDNREVLPSLGAIGADLVFTSPPYNIGLSPGGCGGGFYTPSRGGRSVTKWRDFTGYGTHDDAMPIEEYETWQRQVLQWCWDALSPRGAILYNHKPRLVFGESWLPLSLNPGLPLRQILIWDRGGGIAMGDSHFCPGCEWLMFFAREEFKLRDRAASALGDVWRVPMETKKLGHPAPFPVALPARAIHATAPTLVLDPHMGSGSTLAAAKLAGIRAIGVEIEERYCEIAANRLSQDVLPLGHVS